MSGPVWGTGLTSLPASVRPQAGRGSLVFDPNVGTGSCLVPAAHRGAITLGMDIDMRVVKFGETASHHPASSPPAAHPFPASWQYAPPASAPSTPLASSRCLPVCFSASFSHCRKTSTHAIPFCCAGKKDKAGRHVNVWTNFADYGLAPPSGLLRADLHRSPFRDGLAEVLDAIICDPPYGVSRDIS